MPTRSSIMYGINSVLPAFFELPIDPNAAGQRSSRPTMETCQLVKNTLLPFVFCPMRLSLDTTNSQIYLSARAIAGRSDLSSTCQRIITVAAAQVASQVACKCLSYHSTRGFFFKDFVSALNTRR